MFSVVFNSYVTKKYTALGRECAHLSKKYMKQTTNLMTNESGEFPKCL